MQVGLDTSRTGLDGLESPLGGSTLRRSFWGWVVGGLQFHGKELDVKLRQRGPWGDLSRVLG